MQPVGIDGRSAARLRRLGGLAPRAGGGALAAGGSATCTSPTCRTTRCSASLATSTPRTRRATAWWSTSATTTAASSTPTRSTSWRGKPLPADGASAAIRPAPARPVLGQRALEQPTDPGHQPLLALRRRGLLRGVSRARSRQGGGRADRRLDHLHRATSTCSTARSSACRSSPSRRRRGSRWSTTRGRSTSRSTRSLEAARQGHDAPLEAAVRSCSRSSAPPRPERSETRRGVAWLGPALRARLALSTCGGVELRRPSSDSATCTMEPTVIRLDSVSLRYRLAKQRIPSLKEYAIHLVRGSLTYEALWAVRDVDASIARGERVGIIGRNGAGKSTLLKVISGVLKPTMGKVSGRGDGGADPRARLGLRPRAHRRREHLPQRPAARPHTARDQAASSTPSSRSASSSEFVRTPIRNYSSGMLARLGFAVATAWIPDVLILDEVLSVGDSRFVTKCEQRLRRFHEAGTTCCWCRTRRGGAPELQPLPLVGRRRAARGRADRGGPRPLRGRGRAGRDGGATAARAGRSARRAGRCDLWSERAAGPPRRPAQSLPLRARARAC